MPRPPLNISERLARRAERQPNGCLHWTGYVTPAGYGMMSIGSGGPLGVHVVAFVNAGGIRGLNDDVDHDCHNRDTSCAGGWTCLHRRCIEPSHLVARPRSENLHLGRTPGPAKGYKLPYKRKKPRSQ